MWAPLQGQETEASFMGISNKKGFVLIKKLVAILLLSGLVFSAITFAILSGPATFSDTYQSVIYRKYEQLKNTEGPRIIIVGGSNAGFGIDSEYVSQKVGMPVVNMGLHAGFGPLFNTNIVKNHIQEGDIILLAHEYGLSSTALEKLGDLDLIMAGIDNHPEIYLDLPLKNYPEILGNLFSFAEYKASKKESATGVYSSASFDEKGNMILPRASFIIQNYAEKTDVYGQIKGNQLLPTDDNFEYLNNFRKFAEKKGASVYFVAPVLLKDAYVGTEQQLLDYKEGLEERTEIPYISDPNDYLFPSDYMFDTIYHCNEKGEQKRSELLANDILNNILK